MNLCLQLNKHYFFRVRSQFRCSEKRIVDFCLWVLEC